MLKKIIGLLVLMILFTGAMGYANPIEVNNKTNRTVIDPVKKPSGPVEGITIIKNKETLEVGESRPIGDLYDVFNIYSVSPATADPYAVNVESDNYNVIKIDDGDLIGVAPGYANITISSEDDPLVSQTIQLYCEPWVAICTGTTREIGFTWNYDDEGNFISGSSITAYESLNPDIATVQFESPDHGNVTGIKPGYAKIKLTTNDGDRYSTVRIADPVFTGSVNTDVKIPVNKIYGVSSIQDGYPFDEEASDIQGVYYFNWETGDEMEGDDGSIEGDNIVISPTDTGIYKISVYSSYFSYDYFVNIIDGIPVEWIQIEGPDFINLGETAQLSTYVYPEDATVKDVTWESLDQSVATVDPNGLVTPLKTGTVDIKITSVDNPKATASKTIEVLDPKVPVTGVELIGPSSSLKIGDKYQLICNVFPENATDKSVTYIPVHPNLISVDQNGVVTALANGKAVVWARTNDGYYIAACSISIGTPVERVKLDKHYVKVLNGESVQLNATVLPEDATYKTVKWSSTKKSVATVDKKGLVKTKNTGATTIYCISKDNPEKYDICNIVSYIKLNIVSTNNKTISKVNVKKGRSTKVVADIKGKDYDKGVTWKSSNKNIARVDANGVITGIKAGKVKITATSKYDKKESAKIDVTVYNK